MHSSVGAAAVSYWMAPHRQCPFSIGSSTRRLRMDTLTRRIRDIVEDTG
jgi:hypothetical protein